LRIVALMMLAIGLALLRLMAHRIGSQ